MVTLRCGQRIMILGERTLVMGILNVTPDSFSDGGAFDGPEAAVAHGVALVRAGADVVDIGGESTRPGASPVSPDEEIARVLPVVRGLVARGIDNLSIDTRHAATAEACLEAGASWVNDVSALQHDPRMAEVARRADAVVLMHARHGAFDAREDQVRYGDVVEEVVSFLAARCAHAARAGIDRDHLIVDPGLGFGKTVQDNLRLLAAAARLARVAPVLMGPSRKRFLGAVCGRATPRERDAATLAAVLVAAHAGAHIVRVHDVAAAVDALRVVHAARQAC